HLVIDQTEAMTTIDVNTGAYTGHKNLEETVLKTNLEASQAIARQLRLRNLGGLIVLDFIDMKNEAHRGQVLHALEKELKRDPARTLVFPFSPLGLVEMTRKRTRESLGHILCQPCPACEGRGTVKTVETVCNEILREITRAARQFEAKAFLVIAAPGIIARLTEEQSQALAELEEQLQRPIRLQAESQYLQGNYDVVPL
ncbi:MAG: ribonuclease E/G, partial [Hydrocarboniphaga effusa]|nr:ribonuclease E/G [Hydrocarboniphaga effusa]